MRTARRGHATRPHTADVVVEAWAPTAAGCYEEAVAALVEVFARAAPATGGGSAERRLVEVGPGAPDELLVALLEEVIAVADVQGRVPTDAAVAVHEDRLTVELVLAPPDAIEAVGPVPKGVSYEGLAFAAAGGDDGPWRCRATIDV
jgi:SHS2 domain-containing protein